MADNEGYVAKTWQTGDTIHAGDLNHIEEGIEELYERPAEGGPLQVTFTMHNYIDEEIPQYILDLNALDTVHGYYLADKTFNEILAALQSGQGVIYNVVADLMNSSIGSAIHVKFANSTLSTYEYGHIGANVEPLELNLAESVGSESNLYSVLLSMVSNLSSMTYGELNSNYATFLIASTDPDSSVNPSILAFDDYPVVVFGISGGTTI